MTTFVITCITNAKSLQKHRKKTALITLFQDCYSALVSLVFSKINVFFSSSAKTKTNHGNQRLGNKINPI